jgi:NADPH:quinone reductase-like Zn-dependent oxidoreductase
VSFFLHKLGKDVTEFKPQDQVYGIIPARMIHNTIFIVAYFYLIGSEIQFKTGIGALGQYTIVEYQNLVKKPESIN